MGIYGQVPHFADRLRDIAHGHTFFPNSMVTRACFALFQREPVQLYCIGHVHGGETITAFSYRSYPARSYPALFACQVMRPCLRVSCTCDSRMIIARTPFASNA